MSKPSKLPKQLFIVSKNYPEHEYPIEGDWTTVIKTDHNFGFLHPHEPGKTSDDKRKATQIGWAYDGEVYQRNDEWWHKGSRYDYSVMPVVRQTYDEPIDLLYAPRVWDNTPQTGFKIIDTVSRYRGNKLMKVLDPRGIEFEITIQSLYHLLQAGEVKKGEITVPCVWMGNKNLIVV